MLSLVLAAAFLQATPDHAWSFPRDHWAHAGYRTEWWYVTGIVETDDEPKRAFGFQFTIFKVGVLPERPALDSAWAASDLVLGHASITDVAGRRHVFADALYRAVPLLGGFAPPGENPIAWLRAPAGTPGTWSIAWNGEGFDIEARDDARGLLLRMSTRPTKPLVLQGPNGLSRKGGEAASLYYSFPRLRTEGEIGLGDGRFRVRGESWMDKELGSSQLAEGQVGWDWMGLRLDDGRDLMLYAMRRANGVIDFHSGTLVASDGTPKYLSPAEWTSEATARWTSPRSGIAYPATFRIVLPGEGLRLEVVPLYEDQENVGSAYGGVRYWEGAVEVRDEDGARVGEGYLELTGYGEGGRPPV